eukprot:1156271-Pelagomonas_calceolata.AAC.2
MHPSTRQRERHRTHGMHQTGLLVHPLPNIIKHDVNSPSTQQGNGTGRARMECIRQACWYSSMWRHGGAVPHRARSVNDIYLLLHEHLGRHARQYVACVLHVCSTPVCSMYVACMQHHSGLITETPRITRRAVAHDLIVPAASLP